MDYTLREIKERINLICLANDLGLKGQRGRFWCPFHDNKSRPNMSVRQHSFRCYACGAEGDTYDLVARVRNCDFKEALAYVCDYANVPVPRRAPATTWTPSFARPLPPDAPVRPKKEKGPAGRTTKVLTALCKPWLLDADWADDHPACRYLAGRGISRETAARLGVGYLGMPYNDVSSRLLAKVPLAELQDAGLFNKDGKLRLYKHRLLLPAWLDGEACGLLARNIAWGKKDDGPKELSISHPSVPFNCDALLDGPVRVYITEGPIDCLSLEEMGLAAVGIPGADGFRPEWVSLFDDVAEVVLALDNDDAGRKGSARIGEYFAAAGRHDILSVEWPDGVKDANELLTAGLGGKGVAL